MPHYPPPEVYLGKVGIWLVKLSSAPPTGLCLSSECYPIIKPGGEKGIWLYDSLRTLLVEVYDYQSARPRGENLDQIPPESRGNPREGGSGAYNL